MAMVMSLRKGQSFRVEGVLFVVSELHLPDYVVLRRGDGRVFDIGSGWVFVSLGVRVRMGVARSNSTSIVSLAVEAPGREITRNNFLPPKSHERNLNGTR